MIISKLLFLFIETPIIVFFSNKKISAHAFSENIFR